MALCNKTSVLVLRPINLSGTGQLGVLVTEIGFQATAQSSDVTTGCMYVLRAEGVSPQQRWQLEKLFQRRVSVNGKKKGAEGKTG